MTEEDTKIINSINLDEKIAKEENIKPIDDAQKTKENFLSEFNECFKNNNIDQNTNNLFYSFCMNNNQLSQNDINQIPIVLNKDQLYNSFVLFQQYLYWNMRKNNLQKNTDNNSINNINIKVNEE